MKTFGIDTTNDSGNSSLPFLLRFAGGIQRQCLGVNDLLCLTQLPRDWLPATIWVNLEDVTAFKRVYVSYADANLERQKWGFNNAPMSMSMSMSIVDLYSA